MYTKQEINQLAFEIVGCAITVHKEIGPGLLEKIYEECLCYELIEKGFEVKRQKPIPIIYKNVEVRHPLYVDIIVNDVIIVELKSKDSLHPIDEAQILSYMKLSKCSKGLLINFNVTNIVKEGMKPFVNEYFAKLND